MHGWAMYLEIELHDFMHKIGSNLHVETKIAVTFSKHNKNQIQRVIQNF